MKKLVFGILLITGLVATNVSAASMKIGVVDFQRIVAESPQADSIKTSMLERFGPQREELQAMEKEVIKIQENYKRNELVMTEDKLKEMEKEFNQKVMAMKQKEAALTQEMKTAQNQELAVLQQQILGVIEDIAKNEKYSLVLNDISVPYADEKLDITDKVLEKMKAAFKKK